LTVYISNNIHLGMNTTSQPTRKARRSGRHANAQRVIDLLRSKGPSSQAAISRATALSPATVSNIIQDLRTDGTVDCERVNGRELLVSLASNRGAVISLSVHEAIVHGTLFDFANQQRWDLEEAVSHTGSKGGSRPELVVDVAKHLAEKASLAWSEIAGVAVAIEGPIETSTGAIAPWAWKRLPRWKGVDIHKTLSDALHVPLVVDNDANLAALAEWSWGVGRGCDDFLHITCSEGIGGGLIIGGRIYRGGSGLAGEIGHMVIEESGDLCFCGSRGCLSGFASERATLLALKASESPKVSLIEVIDSARHGDAACQRVLFEAGRHLGMALATVARVLAPSVISIGGTLGLAGEFMFDGLRSSAEVINLRAIAESPRFCIAQITNDATLLGGVAAILAETDQGVSELTPWMRSNVPA
jgi:predicted NBD/HSP70 family sugar kinase/biotin operon repressor